MTSLPCTHIPAVTTLNIIKDNVNNDDEFNRKMPIPQEMFLDLVNQVLITTWSTFNYQFHQQTNGIAL